MKVLRFLLPELFNENEAFTNGLPKITRFQILIILATMWAFIFALITMEFINFGINVTTSIFAHALVIAGIIFTKKQLNNKNYNFGSYHSYGRGREYVILRDKHGNPIKHQLPKNDPGGEHE